MSKACVELGGRTILERQLESIRSARRDAIVYTSPHDVDVERVLTRIGAQLEVRRRLPEGVLADLLAIAGEVGCPFTTLDCDLVVDVHRLAAFLTPQLGDPAEWEAAVAVSRDDRGLGPRTVWVSTASQRGAVARVRALSRGSRPAAGRRLAGAYHWSSAVIARLAAAANSGATSLVGALTEAVRAGSPFAALDVGRTFNVNTPSDLAAAARSLNLV